MVGTTDFTTKDVNTTGLTHFNFNELTNINKSVKIGFEYLQDLGFQLTPEMAIAVNYGVINKVEMQFSMKYVGDNDDLKTAIKKIEEIKLRSIPTDTISNRVVMQIKPEQGIPVALNRIINSTNEAIMQICA